MANMTMSNHEAADVLTNMITKHATTEEVRRFAEYSAAVVHTNKLAQDLDIDTLLTTYGDHDGRRAKMYGRVAVVASSQEAGKEYAEALGIQNYLVVTDVSKAQGMRMRAYVVTPGYLHKMEEARWKAAEVLSAIQQGSVFTDAPQG